MFGDYRWSTLSRPGLIDNREGTSWDTDDGKPVAHLLNRLLLHAPPSLAWVTQPAWSISYYYTFCSVWTCTHTHSLHRVQAFLYLCAFMAASEAFKRCTRTLQTDMYLLFMRLGELLTRARQHKTQLGAAISCCTCQVERSPQDFSAVLWLGFHFERVDAHKTHLWPF